MNAEGKVELQRAIRSHRFTREEFPIPCVLPSEICDQIDEIIAAHAPSVAPPMRGEKRPIARPCSACGDGDTEMKYHDHFPPFADEPGTPSVAEAPAPDEDELYSRHMAELEANWHVHPIPPEDREWINGYKQGWLRHRMRSAPALSESAKEFLSMAREGVANSGRIAGVSDRIDLKVNAQPLQGSSEVVKLDGQLSENASLAEIRRILSRWGHSVWSDSQEGLAICTRTLVELREEAFNGKTLSESEETLRTKLRELILERDSEEDSEGNIVLRFNCVDWLALAGALGDKEQK